MMYARAFTLLHDADDSADVVQEALANLWQNRQRLAGIERIESYCGLTARNIALDRLRARRPMSPIDDTGPATSIPDDSPSRRVDARGELDVVLRLMDSLSESQRTVLRLNAMEGCSCDEIARVTGYTISNVRQLLSRGRLKLRALYRNFNMSKTPTP